MALVSTAPVDRAGSMRAYSDTLQYALAQHARDVETSLVELDPAEPRCVWDRRLQTMMLPVRARRQRALAPDLWHVLDGSRAHVAAALGPAPVLITVHDIIPWLQAEGRFPQAPRTGRAARWIWRRNGEAMRRAAGLVCDSESTAEDVRRAFGISPGRTRVVQLPLRSGLDPADTGTTSAREEVVLHVGNNGFYKARDRVLRIFARIDTAPSCRLAMLGPPPTEALRAEAASLGITDRIDWVADPDDRVLADWYRRASVLVYPSIHEGFGWPVLEAMAFGLPVVASDAGSLPEVVGDAAVRVKVDDLDGFAAATRLLLRSPEAAATAAARGRTRAAAFRAEDFARAMRQAYVDAIDASREAPAA